MGAFVFSEFGLLTQIDKKAGKNVRDKKYLYLLPDLASWNLAVKCCSECL